MPFLFLALESRAQCTGGTNSNVTVTPCYGEETNSSSIPVGRYLTLNVVKGVHYQVQTCDNTDWNTALTVQNTSGNALAVSSGSNFNNNGCGNQSTLTFQSPHTGTVRIYLTRSNGSNSCLTSGSNTSAITITPVNSNTSINTADDAASAGTNTWTGHVYNRNDAGMQPSDANAFTRYTGYTSEAETFTETFGGDNVCFDIQSQSANRIRLNSEYFAVRYRMQSTRPKGCYVADLRADDGIRLTVDGVKVFDRWIEQSAADYTKVFFSLTGSSNLLMEYYETGGGNEVGFTNFSRVSNLLTANTSQTICQGTAPAAISGNNTFTTAPLSSDNRFTVTYQWQRSADSASWSNIGGATGQNYTPADTAAGTHYYRRLARISKTNEAGMVVNCDDESAGARLLIRPRPAGTLSGNTICEGQQGKLVFTGTSGTGPFSLVVAGNTYNGITSGTAFNVTANPATSTSYGLMKITDSFGCIKQ